MFALPYSKIEYVEVLAKTLYFHLADGSVRELRGRLADYEPALLARPGFHKVHRSYLVNFRWVAEVRQGELVTFGGRRLPIARTAYAQVRAAYVDYLFDTGLQKGEDAL